MKVKEDNKIIWILVGIIIVVVILTFLNFKNNNKKVDYGNLTDEEIQIAVNNEIKQMETTELSTLGERDRMEYYVKEFLDAVENKDYEEAYGFLADEFKQNYFPTIAEFEDYSQNKFSSMMNIEHTNFERNGEYYVLWTTMSDALASKDSSGVEMNFVVVEHDLNDFEMSFSVNK